MTKVLVITGRGFQTELADCCAYDFENAIVDATGGDLFIAKEGLKPPGEHYDLVIVVGINFRKLATIYMLAGRPRGTHTIGYVFGGYGSHTTRYRSPVKRVLNPRYRALARMDRIFVGIENSVEKITRDLSIETTYLPMAANVLEISARPFKSGVDRPIAISGFGRQHTETAEALCDRFNRPESDTLFFHNTASGGASAPDRERYRATFWQILRKSQISLAFDHFHANRNNAAEHSYVGPRWFEGLAAGAVIVGKAPPSPDKARLLNWADSTIELPDDPAEAPEFVAQLLADPERLRAASKANLIGMLRQNDWRHRLAEIFEQIGLSRGARFDERLAELDARANQLDTDINIGKQDQVEKISML